MSEPRDVKPFVGSLIVPYFMDYRMIEAIMRDEKCSKAKAKDILAKLWKEAPGHGHS